MGPKLAWSASNRYGSVNVTAQAQIQKPAVPTDMILVLFLPCESSVATAHARGPYDAVSVTISISLFVQLTQAKLKANT